MSGSYAELYRRAREALEQEAETRLERPLSMHERNLFRNCGTLTRLEELGMTIFYAADAAELAVTLAQTSLDGRFHLALDETIPRLEQLLQRPLQPGERQKLRAFGNIEALWAVEFGLHAAELPARDAAFQQLLEHIE